ncbi:LINE-1 type transposase domain-containing 1 [Labeo rohita]|uniref:LINE-1 type transposase domain-containing 1 n=1 Tax=Labeo rohita TaxID=84645 RepID=A0A498NLD1_LABRO|nr:LINE-1 type transposase domain-containing 1 [Labeo rohita]
MLTLEATCTTLSDSNAKYLAKVTDLESRSRWNNIRIIGLPESIEGPRPSSFFSQLQFDILGKDVLSSQPEIDRTHRALIGKPVAGEKPRTVIIRLHRYQQKELIIREARAKRGRLMFQGSPITIYEDYAPELMVQRTKYRGVMTELYKLGLRPTQLFPARLSIRTKDESRMSFSSVSEAEEYVASTRTDSP